MNEPENSTSRSQHVAWHVVVEGLVALLLAVAQLVLLRGLDIGTLLLFGVPPLIAFVHMRHSPRRGTRVVSAAFLALIALGAIISRVPDILPNMRGIDPQLPAEVDRLLMWYAAVYLVFIAGIVPVHVFVGNLKQKQCGEPAQFSTATCVLGLVTTGLAWLAMPVLLGAMLGLWAWPK